MPIDNNGSSSCSQFGQIKVVGGTAKRPIATSISRERSVIVRNEAADPAEKALVVTSSNITSRDNRSSLGIGQFRSFKQSSVGIEKCYSTSNNATSSSPVEHLIITTVDHSVSHDLPANENVVHKLACLFDHKQIISSSSGCDGRLPDYNSVNGDVRTKFKVRLEEFSNNFSCDSIGRNRILNRNRSRSIDSRLNPLPVERTSPSTMGSSSFDLTDDERMSSNWEELKLLDNKQNFTSAKALFENLERQSRQQSRSGVSWTKRSQRTTVTTQIEVESGYGPNVDRQVAKSTTIESDCLKESTDDRVLNETSVQSYSNEHRQSPVSSPPQTVPEVSSEQAPTKSERVDQNSTKVSSITTNVSSLPPPIPPKPKLDQSIDQNLNSSIASQAVSLTADARNSDSVVDSQAKLDSKNVDFSCLNNVAEEFTELVNNLLMLGNDLSPTKSSRRRKSSSSSVTNEPVVSSQAAALEEAVSSVVTYSDAFSSSSTKIVCNESLAVEKATFAVDRPSDNALSVIDETRPTSSRSESDVALMTKTNNVPSANSTETDVLVRRLVFEAPPLSEGPFQADFAFADDAGIEDEIRGKETAEVGQEYPDTSPLLPNRIHADLVDRQSEKTNDLPKSEEDNVKLRQKPLLEAINNDDTREVKSLSCHVSVPQDVEVDFKRLSTCSIDSSSVDHLPLSSFEKYLLANEADIHWISETEFYIDVAGLNSSASVDSSGTDSNALDDKSPSKVTFSGGNVRVFSTYGPDDYDRRNDDIDPISASAEYELERRLEKMNIIDLEVAKCSEGLGISIIGMGVGADAGLEKLGIFIKSIAPGGAVFRDGRVHVCDQIVEVDNKSLVGVSQSYAASVLRSTGAIVRFKLGREKDLDTSEIAQLIRQSLEQDQLAILREQEILARRLNMSNDVNQTGLSSPENQLLPILPSQDRLNSDQNRKCTPPPPAASSTDQVDSSVTSCDSLFDGNGKADACKPSTSTGDGEIDYLISELRKSDESVHLHEYEKVEDQVNKDVSIRAKAKHGATADPSPPTVINTRVEPDGTGIDQLKRQCLGHNSKDSGLDSNQPSHEKINRHPFFEKKYYSMDLSDDEDRMLSRRIDLLESTLTDVKREAEKYQHLLIDSQSHFIDLERKYDSARKRIRDYQDRERTLLDREEAHLKELREKDSQYSNLIRKLSEKIGLLENQLSDAQKKRSSLIEASRDAAIMDGAAEYTVRTTKAAAISDVSPALAYLPSKKITEQVGESTWPKKSQPDSKTRSVSFDTQLPSTSGLSDEHVAYAGRAECCKYGHYHDFGVPQTLLLDSTAAKSKVEAVKQSTIMSARSLPSRHADAEVFVLCHHTVEHAETLKRHPTHVMTAAAAPENQPFKNDNSSEDPNSSLKFLDSNSKMCSSHQEPNSSDYHRSTSGHLTFASPLMTRKLLDLLKLGKRHQSPSNNLEQTMRGNDMGNDKLSEVQHWNCDDVSNFLKTIGMERYTQDFLRNRIDGCKLLQLDAAKLKSMGLSDANDRALIKKRVKQMKLVLEKERKKETKKLLNISLLDKERRLLKH